MGTLARQPEIGVWLPCTGALAMVWGITSGKCFNIS